MVVSRNPNETSGTPADPVVSSTDEKTAEIFRVAAGIFCERGFHATSIHEIAEAVQLTKAGLYYYIKGKRDLLYRIMDLAMQSIEELVIEVAGETTDPEERLRVVIHEHAQLVAQEGSAPFAILVDELEGLEAEEREAIARRQRRYVRFIRSILDELSQADRLRDGVEALPAAYALLGMVLWTPRWYTEGGSLTPSDVARQLSDMALASVLKPVRA